MLHRGQLEKPVARSRGQPLNRLELQSSPNSNPIPHKQTNKVTKEDSSVLSALVSCIICRSLGHLVFAGAWSSVSSV